MTGDARPDVQAAVPWAGPSQGFHATVPNSGSGTNSVCAYAINVNPPNNNPLLGCKSVLVSDDPPVGFLDGITVSGNQARVFGWSFDPNASATSIPVHVDVGNAGTEVLANLPRDDVDAAYGITGQHGFSATVTLQAGSNQVCAYSIGVRGNNPLIGCRTVQPGPNAVSPLAAPAAPPAAPTTRTTTPEPMVIVSAPPSSPSPQSAPASSPQVSPTPVPTSLPTSAPTSVPTSSPPASP